MNKALACLSYQTYYLGSITFEEAFPSAWCSSELCFCLWMHILLTVSCSGSGIFHCDLTEFRRGGSCDGVGRDMVSYLILRTELFVKGEIIESWTYAGLCPEMIALLF